MSANNATQQNDNLMYSEWAKQDNAQLQSTLSSDPVITTARDSGVEPHKQTVDNTSWLHMVQASIRNGASLASLFRLGGATLIVFALSVFLLQGVEATSDLQRYCLLLGQTGVLTLAGFAVGMLLKEPRGARVFFSLSLISVPANFAVLGALIYSIAPWDSIITQYPVYAKWSSASLTELSIAAAAGLVVLLPMTVFSFAVMARRSTFWLSTHYLLASATLLLPVRDTFIVTVLSSALIVFNLMIISARRKQSDQPMTFEARFAQALLYLPAGFLMMRSALLYQVELYLILPMLTGAYYGLRQFLIKAEKTKWTQPLQMVLLVLGVLLASLCTSLLVPPTSLVMGSISFSVIFGLLMLELCKHIHSLNMRHLVVIVWALLSVLDLLNNSLFSNDISAAVSGVALSATIIAISIRRAHLMGLLIGVGALLCFIVVNSQSLIQHLLSTGWPGLASAGVLTIITGSLIEKYWPVVSTGMSQRLAARKRVDTPESPITADSEYVV